MSTHYIRDLDDALRAIEHIFNDKLEDALSDKDAEIDELREALVKAESEIEELKEYKAMYEGLCQ